jgi:hypothetical protein
MESETKQKYQIETRDRENFDVDCITEKERDSWTSLVLEYWSDDYVYPRPLHYDRHLP